MQICDQYLCLYCPLSTEGACLAYLWAAGCLPATEPEVSLGEYRPREGWAGNTLAPGLTGRESASHRRDLPTEVLPALGLGKGSLETGEDGGWQREAPEPWS